MLLTTDDAILKDFIEAVRVLDKVTQESFINDAPPVLSARSAALYRVRMLLREVDYLITAVPVASASAGRKAGV